MSPILFELLLRSIWETVLMTAASGLISLVFGLPLGLALIATERGGIAESLWVNRALGAVINGFRSVPFIILLVALIPVTRLIVGTSIGTWAMAGAIGAGGLGDLAIRYGYQRFETSVMIAVVIVLIILVCGIQWAGDRLVARLDRRG
ncbi:MAG: hypothetical protein E5Y74_19405 [Mesorhizobium sp.]|nr:MAG: hypothetical protein E5Y74_19405 [Mesorhizobium sp.]